jgi:hypothetical protein
MTHAASELARRANPRYLTERAKDAARRKAMDWREGMTQSPTALGIIGGVTGAIIGSMIAKRLQERGRYAFDVDTDEDLSFGTGGEIDYGGRGPYSGDDGIKQKVGEKAGELKEKAVHAKDALKEKVAGAREEVMERSEGLRERLSSTSHVRGRMAGAYRTGVEEQPLLVALGALALGAAAALLLPESEAERRVLATPRGKVREKVADVGEKVRTQVEEKTGIALGGKETQPSPTAGTRSEPDIAPGTVRVAQESSASPTGKGNMH